MDDQDFPPSLGGASASRLVKVLALVGCAILGVLTLLFYLTDWDLAITGHFYDASLPAGERFFLAEREPWRFLYEYDELFVVAYALVTLVFVACGLAWRERRALLRYGLYLFLALAVGPGLLVNVVFKGMWGRPRPRDTVYFPNDASGSSAGLPFYRVWQPAFLDGMTGASFPSGHPSTPLCFLAIFLVLSNEENFAAVVGVTSERAKLLLGVGKWAALGVSVGVGTLTGVARVIQGGHFASDVLWSFGFVWLTCAALYYWAFGFPRWESRLISE
ncbi:MAG: phosphatase PAP2 family protein [Promethearchaeota archaeon]